MGTHSTAMKVALAGTARTTMNAGTGALQAAEFQKADDAVICSVPLSTTPWGAADVNGTIAASVAGTGTVGNGGGTPTKGRVKDKDGTVTLAFTVGTSGAEVNFNTVTWPVSATVTLTSLTYTPA